MFVRRGARLIQADAIAAELMQPDQTVFDEVVRVFGRGILTRDGTIYRRRLAALAFGEPGQPGSARVKELNAIVHPAVVKRENEWMEEVGRSDPHAIAIVEAALIL